MMGTTHANIRKGAACCAPTIHQIKMDGLVVQRPS
jgi:hypothetical protein